MKVFPEVLKVSYMWIRHRLSQFSTHVAWRFSTCFVERMFGRGSKIFLIKDVKQKSYNMGAKRFSDVKSTNVYRADNKSRGINIIFFSIPSKIGSLFVDGNVFFFPQSLLPPEVLETKKVWGRNV